MFAPLRNGMSRREECGGVYETMRRLKAEVLADDYAYRHCEGLAVVDGA